jgi:hypothetical protein
VVSALIQELVRYVVVLVYAKSERAVDRLIRPGGPKLFNDLSAGIAAGLGFSFMHTIMMYGSVLLASSGEATWYAETCPGLSMFVVTALQALCYHGLHVLMMIWAMDAYRRWTWSRTLMPFVVHPIFALLGVLVEVQNGCVAVFPSQLAVLVLLGIGVVRLVRAPDYTARKQLRAWEVLTRQRVEAMRTIAEAQQQQRQQTAQARAVASGSRQSAVAHMRQRDPTGAMSEQQRHRTASPPTQTTGNGQGA